MAKIAFVYPNLESLGLGYLSSYLKSKGHETRLFLDPQLFEEDHEKVNSKYLLAIAEKVKTKLFNIFIIYGQRYPFI